MKKILIVVDMQNDFISGSLGSEDAQKIVPNVVRKIEEWEGDIICTLDTHGENYMETREGKFLPTPHCIEGTKGHQIEESVYFALLDQELQGKNSVSMLKKRTFGSTALPEIIRGEDVGYIELIGLCTDICVVSNAMLLKAHYPDVEIVVDASCCAGVTPEKHKAALEVMKSCQIIILNETPFISEEKGCIGCKYEGISHNNYPCCDCARSDKDYYLKEVR